MNENARSAVEQAVASLHGEHQHIDELVRRIRESDSSETITGLLEELHDALKKHFAHEEYPGGLYHSLGACTAEHRRDLRVLVDQHFNLLSATRGLLERARLGGPEQRQEIVKEADQLAARLREHETHEHELAKRLAGA
jgi:hypothetical protein